MNNWLILALAIAAIISFASFLDGDNNQNGFSA
jgi:hypothetical protein